MLASPPSEVPQMPGGAALPLPRERGSGGGGRRAKRAKRAKQRDRAGSSGASPKKRERAGAEEGEGAGSSGEGAGAAGSAAAVPAPTTGPVTRCAVAVEEEHDDGSVDEEVPRPVGGSWKIYGAGHAGDLFAETTDSLRTEFLGHIGELTGRIGELKRDRDEDRRRHDEQIGELKRDRDEDRRCHDEQICELTGRISTQEQRISTQEQRISTLEWRRYRDTACFIGEEVKLCMLRSGAEGVVLLEGAANPPRSTDIRVDEPSLRTWLQMHGLEDVADLVVSLILGEFRGRRNYEVHRAGEVEQVIADLRRLEQGGDIRAFWRKKFALGDLYLPSADELEKIHQAAQSSD